nr:PREDICTED: scaffold attachment factor B2-like [Bos indicus]
MIEEPLTLPGKGRCASFCPRTFAFTVPCTWRLLSQPRWQKQSCSLQGSVAFVAGKLLQRKSSVCPTALNSVVNFVSSQQAVKEEGQDPDEIGIALEATSKKTKRFVKEQKAEEEGTEDNGLEEDSRDGQEDMEASLEGLQSIDMMDVNVLEETEVENSAAPDFGEDGTDSILESLCESKDYVATQLRELPAQFAGHAVDGEGFENTLDASSLDFKVPPVGYSLVLHG